MRRAFAYDAVMALIVGMALFVAALPALRAYQATDGEPLLALAAIGPVMIAFSVGRLLRWSAVGSYLISLAGLALLLLVLSGFHPSLAYAHLLHGPNRILTETLPLGGGVAALTSQVVVTWICAAVAGELLARGGPRGSKLLLVLPIGLFVVCYGASVSAPHRDDAAGPVLLVVLGAAALCQRHRATLRGPRLQPTDAARSGDEAGSPRYGPFTAGLATVGAVAALAWAVSPDVPALTRRPASVHRTPPTLAPVVTDPVDALAQLRDGDPSGRPRPELTVDMSAPSTGYLAVAVLHSYDGAVWRLEGKFDPTGGRVPGPTRLSTDHGEITQQVTSQAVLPVPLLPALDRPVHVSGLAVATDPSTGMLVPQGSNPGLVSYTVVSDTPNATLGLLPPVDALGSTSTATDLSLPPDTSPDLATTARYVAALTGQRPAPTLSFLQAVVAALRDNDRRIDPALAPSSPGTSAHIGGTSLSEVINAVTVNRAASPEQFATFVAMIARYLGVPSRVVTGFRIAPASGSATVPRGRYQVTSRQAWAWVEIPVAGVGWVVADATPDRVTGVATPPPESVQAPPATVPPRQANVVPRPTNAGGHALAPAAPIRVPRSHPAPAWVLVLAVVAGLIVAGLMAGPGQAAVRRWRRRWARRSSDPAELAVGAWLELLDGLARSGLQPDPGSTGREVAAEAAGCFGPDVLEAVEEVGRVAERAVFSMSNPPEHDTARQAWEVQRSVCRQVRRGLAGRDRLRASVLVGSAPRRPGKR
ncbi:MAG: DUF4129 domain-containing protein [Acidimicrobiales bacterium]|nr:DUF4129 domain-containing protein [Acidimicrobiales bacterium]